MLNKGFSAFESFRSNSTLIPWTTNADVLVDDDCSWHLTNWPQRRTKEKMNTEEDISDNTLRWMRTTYLHWNYFEFNVWVNFRFDEKIHCCWMGMKDLRVRRRHVFYWLSAHQFWEKRERKKNQLWFHWIALYLAYVRFSPRNVSFPFFHDSTFAISSWPLLHLAYSIWLILESTRSHLVVEGKCSRPSVPY